MRKKKDLIELVMSMMMALGGVSIRLIAQSQDIRRAFTLDGYSIPDSANTIREMVLRFASYVQKGGVNVVRGVLSKYGFVESDIAAITTDGAKVMRRYITFTYQLCMAHRLHLAVMKVFYY